MVASGAKGGEGMGRAAAADVLGGWEGMVPASPDHARYPRPPRPPRPCPPRRTLFRPLSKQEHTMNDTIAIWYIAKARDPSKQESRSVPVCSARSVRRFACKLRQKKAETWPARLNGPSRSPPASPLLGPAPSHRNKQIMARTLAAGRAETRHRAHGRCMCVM